MLDQKSNISTIPMQNANLQSYATPNKNPGKKGIDLWLRSVEKWKCIIKTWKKESALLQKLVNLSMTGRSSNMEKMQSQSTKLSNMMTEIDTFEKELLHFVEQVPLMHRNGLYYHNQYASAKSKMKELARQYDGVKSNLLEELAISYPVSIF